MYKIFINFFDGSAIRVKDGIIDKIGEETSSFIHSADEIIDCGGNFVYPAFSDKHAHLSILAIESLGLNLSDVRSLEDLAKKIKECREDIIVGRGWDESLWNGEMPNREFLDSIDPYRPIFLVRIDGHMAVLNTKAWHIFDPLGDFRNGFIYEKEVEKVLSRIQLDERRGLKNAIEQCVKEGVTEIFEMCGTPSWYEKIIESNPPIDVRVFIHEGFECIETLKRSHGNVKLDGIKIFADGSIGAKTAAVSTGYTDGRYIRPFLERNQIRAMARFAESLNLKLAVHAIGDLAIVEAVEALRDSRETHRIEHFELVPDEYLENLEKLGNIHVCMQPNFLRWASPGSLYEKNLGKEWCKRCNPFAVLEKYSNLSLGSDSMPLSPRYGLKLLQNPPYPIQKMKIERAIELYSKSKIKVGEFADFIVTDGKLPDCEILMTVSRGEVLFSADHKS